MKFASLLISLAVFAHEPCFAACEDGYPSAWWKPVPRDSSVPSWEILPQDAKCPELILSKRNADLALLSNFAPTPFLLDGVEYASIEGFWQMMKYPDPEMAQDLRRNLNENWPYSREAVQQLTGFEAKKAGQTANEILNRNAITWWSFGGFPFYPRGEHQHYHLQLVTRAISAKIDQNRAVAEVLRKTEGLVLRPDHIQDPQSPPAWRYQDILMRLRR